MRNESLNCGREHDLISFLYGELKDVESIAFEQHLRECAACEKELAGFAPVRESVVAWRNESLSGIGFPAQTPESSSAAQARTKPSAVAAVREFFNLSPVWMKGAVAFATIVFCILAGLAVARLRDKPPVAIVTGPVSAPNSPQELNAIVEKRVQEELSRIKNSEQSSNALLVRNGQQRKSVKQSANRSTEIARRPLSKTEREQLAADLRLVSSKDFGDLDLLGDRINQ